MKNKSVLLSIKPEFATQIIKGKKQVELRKKFPQKQVIGELAFIYASSPIQALIGYAIIKDISFLFTNELWEKYGSQSNVNKNFFDQYFKNTNQGFAIHLINPIHLKRTIPLKELKEKYNICAPQSYRYLSKEVLKEILQ
jgi:predicted transcriptional regulator